MIGMAVIGILVLVVSGFGVYQASNKSEKEVVEEAKSQYILQKDADCRFCKECGSTLKKQIKEPKEKKYDPKTGRLLGYYIERQCPDCSNSTTVVIKGSFDDYVDRHKESEGAFLAVGFLTGLIITVASVFSISL